MRLLTRFAPKLISAALLSAGVLFSSLAFADYAEVNRLMRAGQFAEATAKADQFLAGKPKDPQMRFLKGVILTEQGKPQDAITTFTKLIEDYPELPEPYNNLAVLHAGQGQFDKARAALEMAIRTNPSYATAHENLGDVYAKLASQAYSKALQLDGSNSGIQPKLGLIRDLFAPNIRTRPAAAAAAPSAAAPAKPAVVAAAPTPATAPTPAPAPAPAASAAKPPVAAAAPAAPAAAGNEDEVRAAVQAWASAWSRKDMASYLGAYGKEFDAPGGRKSWEEERRKRIMGKNKISVQVSNLDIKITGNKAQARFKQDYDADSLSVNSRKTLDLVRADNRWVIVREATGG
ncbi:nuclear transport factor 2 family protein [Variovorax sp. PCZ-1]|uniref:nuclear transport factor 2 family protein n=1 Tax=Variovorax sp. PCZ-1 TaxID=2835533 RepID=UPI001BCF33E2|nr:nuclear transport factor 2 family protein [Variovorax sp. PCZ-1]MBS7807702.1 tetratricopeptide repeat protein [Variovorax sp. PCZ-1]